MKSSAGTTGTGDIRYRRENIPRRSSLKFGLFSFSPQKPNFRDRRFGESGLYLQRDQEMAFRIRPAQPEDAPALAVLAGQLGYPTAPEEMTARLQTLAEDDRHAVFVAVKADGEVVGWIHIYLCPLLIASREAVIGGLVVDENHHSRGVGTRLVQEAEDWARARGCEGMTVRTNVVRERTPAFYRRLGFREVKVQRVFHKCLKEEP